MTDDFPSAPDYGRSLKGFGVNMLVPDMDAELAFLTQVLACATDYADKDFAVVRWGGAEDGMTWMLHADHTYHQNPLLALTGDGAIRGAGVEFHLYNGDPDRAVARARDGGYEIFAEARDKPHGLYEAYLASPAGYIYVVSRSSA